MGLSPLDEKSALHKEPLLISNLGQFQDDGHFVNNQTMVNSSEGYYFKKNIGLFEFVTGNQINVLTDYNEQNTDFARTLLNYPIACAFFQKKLFSLHASAVFFEGKVIMFPGSALTGKSTIAAYFLKNGGQLITEDTATIEVLNNRAYVRSSYPFIKLSKSASTELSFSSANGIPLATDRNARLGYLLDDIFFTRELLPIDYCVFLEFAHSESIIPVKSSDLILKLLGCSMNIYPLSDTKHKELFHWSANLTRCFKSFRFQRRRGIFHSRFLVDFIVDN